MATEPLSPEEITELPASDLAEIVLAFRTALFPDGNAEQDWGSDTLSHLGEVCVRYGLIPADSATAGRSLH